MAAQRFGLISTGLTGVSGQILSVKSDETGFEFKNPSIPVSSNNTYLKWRNVDNTADLSVFGLNNSDDLIINYPVDKNLYFKRNNQTVWSIDPNGYIIQDAAYGNAIKFYKNYSGIQFNNGTFTINSHNSAADTGLLRLASSNTVGAYNGAYIELYGNSHATYPGKVLIQAGSNGSINLQTATLNLTNNVTFSGANFIYGLIGTYYIIRADTADGSDNRTITITAGGSGLTAADPARGGGITLYGNEVANVGGDILLMSGTPGKIKFSPGGPSYDPKWTMASDGHFIPGSNNYFEIGSSTNKVKTVYTNNLYVYNGAGNTGEYIKKTANGSEWSTLAFQWSTSEQVWPFEKASDGSTLYCKQINFGTLADTGTAQVAHGISSWAISKLFRISAKLVDSTTSYELPKVTSTSTEVINGPRCTTTNVEIETYSSSYTSATATVFLIYQK